MNHVYVSSTLRLAYVRRYHGDDARRPRFVSFNAFPERTQLGHIVLSSTKSAQRPLRLLEEGAMSQTESASAQHSNKQHDLHPPGPNLTPLIEPQACLWHDIYQRSRRVCTKNKRWRACGSSSTSPALPGSEARSSRPRLPSLHLYDFVVCISHR